MHMDPDLVWMAVAALVLCTPTFGVLVYRAVVRRKGPLRINLSWRRRRRR